MMFKTLTWFSVLFVTNANILKEKFPVFFKNHEGRLTPEKYQKDLSIFINSIYMPALFSLSCDSIFKSCNANYFILWSWAKSKQKNNIVIFISGLYAVLLSSTAGTSSIKFLHICSCYGLWLMTPNNVRQH